MEIDPEMVFVCGFAAPWYHTAIGILMLLGVSSLALRLWAGLARRYRQLPCGHERFWAWRAAAEALGLELHRDERGRFRLQGTLDGVRVLAAEEALESPDSELTRFRATLERGEARSISLLPRARHGFEWPGRPGGLLCGDAAFDAALRIGGEPADALARLTAPVRGQALALLGRFEGGIGRDEVDLWRWGHNNRDALVIEDTVRACAALARALELGGESVEERLRHNVEADPVAGVRRRSLEMLLARVGPGHAEAQAALAGARAGGDLVLRAMAAERAGDVQGLRAALDRPEAAWQELDLDGALRTVELLERLAASSAAGEGDAAVAEKRLLGLLEHDEPAVQAAAARALGAAGSALAVEPLMRRTHGLLASTGLKQAAREAVAAIQSRLVGTDGGALSLAAEPEPAGALSLAGDAEGGLSLPAGGAGLAGIAGLAAAGKDESLVPAGAAPPTGSGTGKRAAARRLGRVLRRVGREALGGEAEHALGLEGRSRRERAARAVLLGGASLVAAALTSSMLFALDLPWISNYRFREAAEAFEAGALQAGQSLEDLLDVASPYRSVEEGPYYTRHLFVLDEDSHFWGPERMLVVLSKRGKLVLAGVVDRTHPLLPKSDVYFDSLGVLESDSLRQMLLGPLAEHFPRYYVCVLPPQAN